MFLDGSSGTGTVTIVTGFACKNFDCTGYTGTLAHSTSVAATCAGTVFKLNSTMVYTPASSSTWTFTLAAGTCAITSAGKTLGRPTFNGAATFQFQDALHCDACTDTNGNVDAETFNVDVTVKNFACSNNANVRQILMGTGTWTLTGTGTIWNTGVGSGITVVGDNATIVVQDTSATTKSLSFGSMSLNTHRKTLTIPSGSGTVAITGVTTWDTGTMGTVVVTVGGTAGQEITFGTLTLNGTTLRGATPGTASPVTITASATATGSTITDVNANGGCSIDARDGTNVNGGNVSNVLFAQPKRLMLAGVG